MAEASDVSRFVCVFLCFFPLLVLTFLFFFLFFSSFLSLADVRVDGARCYEDKNEIDKYAIFSQECILGVISRLQ